MISSAAPYAILGGANGDLILPSGSECRTRDIPNSPLEPHLRGANPFMISIALVPVTISQLGNNLCRCSMTCTSGDDEALSAFSAYAAPRGLLAARVVRVGGEAV